MAAVTKQYHTSLVAEGITNLLTYSSGDQQSVMVHWAKIKVTARLNSVWRLQEEILFICIFLLVVSCLHSLACGSVLPLQSY
jgi:hypothetical protein